MEIIPAIDLRNGKCVRLYQGDYDMETVFSEDPVTTALEWQSQGATRLHIVDLDGAAAGEPRNLDIISKIANAVLIPVQVGGGIRSLDTIKKLFKLGIDRAILGTAAAEEPQLVKEACRLYGQSIIVSIDARDGKLATHGWRQETELGAVDFARSMADLGVRRFIHTDISRDGTLTEPNLSAIFELVDATKFRVIASGGISSLIHIRVLKKLGLEGVIIGKALYTGDIKIKSALEIGAR
jgi:phosphoribosylformimino-5-aminoimidazole carboxamide ribotide isomerase